MRALQAAGTLRMARTALATIAVTAAAVLGTGMAASVVAFGALGVAASVLEPVMLSGEVRRLQVDTPGDAVSGGTIEVGGARVVIPPGLEIGLPAGSLPLPALFSAAPAPCRGRGESGFARADACRAHPALLGLEEPAGVLDTTPRSGLAPKPDVRAPIAVATVSGTRDEGGRFTALTVALSKNVERVWGAVSYVDTVEGYLRVNGPFRQDEGGMLVRFNDPYGYQSVQRGVACGLDGNCSADARFRMDHANASIRFTRGNPACIPSDDVPGLCADSNRPVHEDDLASPVPIRPGDHVKAVGAFEIAGGIRFFSAQALIVETDPGRRR